ncbi:MAG: hypothetical protein ACRDJC_10565 [Thermomicrobiales bacterium]
MASKRGVRRRRCAGKHDYLTPALALRDAARLSREQWMEIEAYRCPNCGGIHVGHVPHLVAPAPRIGGKVR